eukprot:808762-Karenia_brevis.AAC.1
MAASSTCALKLSESFVLGPAASLDEEPLVPSLYAAGTPPALMNTAWKAVRINCVSVISSAAIYWSCAAS